MSLSRNFREATDFVDALSEKDHLSLETTCLKILDAQKVLTAAAAGLLDRCIRECEGLCCRNIAPDTLIDAMDFVFILGLNRNIGDAVSRCLHHENPLYTADCIFLKDGIGPCLFPVDLRPQACIISFCGGDHGVRKEIARIKKAFFRLAWFVRTRKLRILGARVTSTLRDC